MKRTLRKFMILTLIACAISACSESDNEETPVDSPVSGTWRVTSVKVSQSALTQPAPNGEDILVSFENDGTFSGSTGANTFSGRYELVGANTLAMLEFTSTEVADTSFAGIFYDAIEAAILPNSTTAQFGYSFDGSIMNLVFGAEGLMTLQAQQSE